MNAVFGPGRLVGFGFLLLIGLVASPPARAPVARSQSQGELVGIVTDMATGDPLLGARVRAGDQETSSDRAGRFRLSVRPGRYDVRIEAPGYGGATVVDRRVAGGTQRLAVALPPLFSPPGDLRRTAGDAGGPAADTTTEADGSRPSVTAREPVRVVPATTRVLMPDGEVVEMETDTYLKGVVPAEMGFIARRAFEALQAQAIASRTYAATSCLADSAGDSNVCEPGLDANVDTTTRTQVWRPVHYDLTDAAVEATHGRVVTHGDALIQALFFARTRHATLDSEASPCCGGRRLTYLRAVSSPEAFLARRGHGAGLSQEGAAVLADWGASAEEILAHYYTGAAVAITVPVSPTATVSPAVAADVLPAIDPGAAPPPGDGGVETPPDAAPGDGGAETHPGATTLAGAVTIDLRDLDVVQGAAELTAGGLSAANSAGLTLAGPVNRTEFPFMALAAHWRAWGPAAARVRLKVRTSRDGSAWSDWTPLLAEELDVKADAPLGEYWSRLLITRGRFVQAQVMLPPAPSDVAGAEAEPSALEGLTLHYLDADAGPAARAARALATGPAVITRSAWGADERLRLDDQGQEIWPAEYIQPHAQIVHHTVTTNDPADPAAVVRSIYYYHAITRGWGDIGYNFLLDHRGNVYEGRYGGERPARIVAGGHAREYNTVAIGVALLGTFTASDSRPTAAAEAALVEILASRGVRYGIEPNAPVTLLDNRLAHSVLGHRDVGQTECPGDGEYARLGATRTGVVVRMAELRAEPVPTASLPPTPRPTTPRPPVAPLPPPTAVQPPTALPGECPDLVAGGDFEVESDRWRRSRAYYTRWDAFHGQTSLFVGLRNSDPDDAPSYASLLQTIRVPERIERAQLTFAVATVGDEADRRLVRLIDDGGNIIALGSVSLPANSAWAVQEFDVGDALGAHPGEDVHLYFGVVNNGDGRRSYVRLDDVTLVICPPLGGQTPPTGTPGSPTATAGDPSAPSATLSPSAPAPSPSATPLPVATTVCESWIEAGDFETGGLPGWEVSGGQPALWVSEPVHSGRGALRLGLAEGAADGFDYAAAAQPITLPVGVVSATLSLWLQPLRFSPEDAVIVELRQPADGARRLLLGPASPVGGTGGGWEQRRLPIDLTGLGRRLELFIAVLNRGQAGAPGAVTALAVDDVGLEVCYRPQWERYLPALLRLTP